MTAVLALYVTAVALSATLLTTVTVARIRTALRERQKPRRRTRLPVGTWVSRT
ncbi:hypothetical protein [Kocuria rosea]|jgi:hypothetical protein|uniref:hypothetical protein n=1 Tax=Kocuria rosea TaxID=1275 RepID=UPI00203B1C09|nr:hypothetical protein [Kocuria rosea]MCM3689587.1 hypothetical protein [Kocuria rosea]